MATRKKSNPDDVPMSQSDLQSQKAKTPLVFISHDTRDAELAEEFNNLLTRASAGALQAFRSSDKKGTQGIEYGLDWYPAIMEKIDEATDVVCLLTRRSVERPWILYEAGVAKGKLNKKVIGIAMGIPHKVAFTGPFAQFQNNDGSVDAITKLVLELVGKMPALNPDHKHVEQLVKEFHEKANEIIKQDQSGADTELQESNETIVPKLFEEVKIMFESLTSRIDHQMDPDFRRKRRRIHPMMLEEFMHMSGKEDDPVGILMAASIVKDDLPWLYELAMDAYRVINSGKADDIEREADRIIRASEMISHGPFMHEFGYGSKELHMVARELTSILEHNLRRIADHKRLPRRHKSPKLLSDKEQDG